jgi:hypothetical protein
MSGDVIGVPPASDVSATITALAALDRDAHVPAGVTVMDGFGWLWLVLVVMVMGTRGWR